MDDLRDRLSSLLPAPRSVVAVDGRFTFPPVSTVAVDGYPLGPRLVDCMGLLPFGVREVIAGGGAADLRVVVEDVPGPEGAYRLRCRPDGVRITAAGVDGVVNAVHTLRQLLPVQAFALSPDPATVWTVPAVDIEDAPHFGWRGALIDVARHFLPLPDLLRQIDLLAAHKINRVQLHLSDDQGWRVESRAFPRLHEVGSVRATSRVSHWDVDEVLDGTPHGGYYTADQLRQVVRFAALRGVTVVPEIDLPGHTGALIAAYPELGSPRLAQREVLSAWGINDALLNPGPRTLEFLEELFGEIAAIFDGPWVHVGGDESLLEAWSTDPDVLALSPDRRRSEGEIFAEFLAELERILTAHGRTMISWDDGFATAAEAGSAATSQVITAWRGAEVAQRAAAAGHDVVLAPIVPTYFDYAQSEGTDEPLSIGGPVTLDHVAGWQPVPVGWSAAERGRVLGVQCHVWTEFIPDPRHLEYMLWPRAAAFAQVAWDGGGAASAAAVQSALPAHLARLDAAAVGYRPLEGPRRWQRGGTGDRAHHATIPLSQVEEELRAAAGQGRTFATDTG